MKPLRALLFATLVFSAMALAANERPNIIFVLFDDLGWGQPQSYNPQSALRTPNLDKLASQGMRLTDAHTVPGKVTKAIIRQP
jgi:arylsulfatase A-like enzyme